MRLTDRHVVVTGAASGIGRALAQACSREGARVSCLDLDAEGAAATAATLPDARVGRCDITDYAEVRESLAAAVDGFGPVDVLLANAGGAQGNRIPFLKLDPASWTRMIERNLTGPFHTGLVYAEHMAERGRGSIVFTTSQSSAVAVRDLAHYTAAKAGLTQLVRSMAYELAEYGVRVNAVAPGATLTPGNERQVTTPESQEFFARVIPMARVARPEEIAGAAVYLAGDEASYTTGTTIVVDGGYTII